MQRSMDWTLPDDMVDDEVFPSRGAVVPNRGAVVPNRGAVVPNRGAVVPNRGAVVPNRGAVVPNRGAVVPSWGATPYLRYSGVPQASAFLNISLKILVSKCHQTLKQIAMGSPLDVTNYISLL